MISPQKKSLRGTDSERRHEHQPELGFLPAVVKPAGDGVLEARTRRENPGKTVLVRNFPRPLPERRHSSAKATWSFHPSPRTTGLPDMDGLRRGASGSSMAASSWLSVTNCGC